MPIHVSGLLALSLALLGTQPQVLVGETGTTRLVLDSPHPLGGMRWDEYAKTAAKLKQFLPFVPLNTPLEQAGEDTRYGLNAVLPVGDIDTVRNLSWALLPQRRGAPILIVDRNADGDLSNDAPLRLRERVEDGFAAEELWSVQGFGDDDIEALRLRWLARNGANGFQLLSYPVRERRGSIRVKGSDVGFALRTTSARFDSSDSLVGLDLNRDGELAFMESDVEVFRVEDGAVVLDGTEYSLVVDRSGRRLTLHSTGRQLDERPTLAIGTKAPELAGEVNLNEYRGRPVLLVFWSPHCSGPKKVAATLREAKKTFPGVQFISITDVTSDEASRFSDEHQHDWPQVSGASGVEVFELYRVSLIPTYYVLDAESVILARGHPSDWQAIHEVLASAVLPR